MPINVEAVYHLIQNGGPPTIFLLLLFFSLILTGVLRLGREVEASDLRCTEQKKLNDDLLVRVDRLQSLQERTLDLWERQVLPLLDNKAPLPTRRR